MNKKWMPITAGIIDLIGGVGQLGFSAYFIYFAVYGILAILTGSGEDGTALVAIFFGLFALPGIMAIIGGIFALKRKRWKLALVGSFLAFLPFASILPVPLLIFFSNLNLDWNRLTAFIFISVMAVVILLGVTAPVLTILSRKQFERK